MPVTGKVETLFLLSLTQCDSECYRRDEIDISDALNHRRFGDLATGDSFFASIVTSTSTLQSKFLVRDVNVA